MPNPVATESLRNQFLGHIHSLVDYWNGPLLTEKDLRSRLDGLAFSILIALDGCSIDLPMFDVVARPHPDDKKYHIERDEDWIEDGTVISDVMLHEMYCQSKRGDS